MARTINDPSAYAQDEFTAGYFNTTAAIDEVRFQGSTGNFNGDICLYGIS